MGLGVFDQYVVAGREMHAVGVDVADHEVAQDDAMGLVATHAVGAAVELTPAERARRDLLALEQDQLLERGEQDTYFARVTDILRLYLEARFDLHAPRKTTREFLNDAERDAALEPNHRAVLHRLLQLADLVKFARHEPHVDAGHDAMRTARTFVDDTEPTSEPHTQTLEPAGGAA